MSEKMTQIRIPNGHWGFGNYGTQTREHMIQEIKRYAEFEKRKAEAILATADADFVVYTCNGVHIERNRQYLMHDGTIQKETPV